MELAARKQKILSAIIENYIITGEPVGSKALINQTGLAVSSATVRNDMADLTGKGYLIQPHTSAGRIPTNQAYRYYVDRLMTVTPVSQRSKEYIESVLYDSSQSPEDILSEAARLLSELLDCVAVATTPSGETSRVRKISFVQTGAYTAMVVMIASNGVIKTQLFRCGFVLTPNIMEVFDKALNEFFVGVRLSSINLPFIQATATKFGELALLIPNAMIAIRDAALSASRISICKSGITRMLFMNEASFSTTRVLAEFLKNDADLAAMLERLPTNTSVSIGRENSRVELASNAVISTRYKVDDSPPGVLAVITPVRTDYGKAISIIQAVADCAGKLISELIKV